MLCFAMKSRSVERALDGRESRGEAFANFRDQRRSFVSAPARARLWRAGRKILNLCIIRTRPPKSVRSLIGRTISSQSARWIGQALRIQYWGRVVT
jgi:hypothetical protein